MPPESPADIIPETLLEGSEQPEPANVIENDENHLTTKNLQAEILQ